MTNENLFPNYEIAYFSQMNSPWFRKIYSGFALLVLCCTVHAQSFPDIAGDWYGTATVPLLEDVTMECHIEQHGSGVVGYWISRTANKKDSAKAVMIGTVTEKRLELKGKSFEYKTYPACLSLVTLTYSVEEGEERLTGKWTGDWSLNTCPPGVGGKVELKKVPTTSIPAVIQKETSYDGNDIYGEELLRELRNKKYFALLIGINDYIDGAIADLDRPVADVNQVKEVLQSTYTFDPAYTTTLTNPTRDKIIEAFDELSTKITPKDQLLIFFAGHGIWDEQLQQGYWLPSDASKQSKARWLSNSTIRDYIGGIKSKHTLLITDACFSGGIFKERGITVSNGRAMLEMYKLPSRKAMTSGTLTTVPDKSVFVQYLVKKPEGQ